MALSIGSSHKLVVSSLNIVSKFNKIFIIGNSRSVLLSQPLCLSCSHSTMSPRKELQNQQKSRSLLSPLPCSILNIVQRRDKKTKKNDRSTGYESESDSDDEQFANITGTKIVKAQTDSLRSDAVVRQGLTISRNKYDILFYEGRLRINGARLRKRSQEMKIGDEIDIVKGFSEENPKLLAVSKVEVLNARPSGDAILLTLRRTRTTLVPNFEIDPWDEKAPPPPENEKELG